MPQQKGFADTWMHGRMAGWLIGQQDRGKSHWNTRMEIRQKLRVYGLSLTFHRCMDTECISQKPAFGISQFSSGFMCLHLPPAGSHL